MVLKTMQTISRHPFFCMLTLLVLLAGVQKGYAQTVYKEQKLRTFSGGFVAGANFSTIDDHDFIHYTKIGANLGGIGFMRFSYRTDLSVEVLFSQKGRNTSTFTGTNKPGLDFIKMYDRLNYIEVPVMINYIDAIKDHFGVGLSYGRLMNYSEKYVTDRNLTVHPSPKYVFNQDDIELLAGAEVHLYKNIYLTVRYQYSLLRIRQEGFGGFTSPGQHNNLWALRIVYLFN